MWKGAGEGQDFWGAETMVIGGFVSCSCVVLSLSLGLDGSNGHLRVLGLDLLC